MNDEDPQEAAANDEDWEALEAQLAFALQERDRDPGRFLRDVDPVEGTVTLRTSEDSPGERVTFYLTPEDFEQRIPRLARSMVARALGPE